jgi:hypothetical protein
MWGAVVMVVIGPAVRGPALVFDDHVEEVLVEIHRGAFRSGDGTTLHPPAEPPLMWL